MLTADVEKPVTGKWSDVEKILLTQELARLLEVNNLHPSEVCPGLGDVNDERKKMTRNHPFWTDLHSFFPLRPFKSVYQAANRMFLTEHRKKLSDSGVDTTWNEQAITQLIQLQTQYGCNWSKIGRIMQRQKDTCKKTYERHTTTRLSRGHYSQEEDDDLIKK